MSKMIPMEDFPIRKARKVPFPDAAIAGIIFSGLALVVGLSIGVKIARVNAPAVKDLMEVDLHASCAKLFGENARTERSYALLHKRCRELSRTAVKLVEGK